MSLRTIGSVGIVPPGALGVSFFYHLTSRLTHLDGRVFFVGRPGSISARELQEGMGLRIADTHGIHTVKLENLLNTGLLAGDSTAPLPELLMVCPNPNQILPTLLPCIQLLEKSHQVGRLAPDELPFPTVVLCSNGIYFQRIRQVFIEALEESTLMGRLPDLWPDLMPRIVARLLRGVTIQTSIRDGNGPQALYRPGPPGLTRIAGGDSLTRRRAVELLHELGASVESADDASPTRVEFDKAIINLTANLLGQLAAIDEDGAFSLLTIGQVLEKVGFETIHRLGTRVVEVGKAVRAYGPREQPEAIIQAVILNLQQHAEHIPSSLQWLGLRLRRGEAVGDIAPTELWLLEPLIHYSRSAQLPDAASYFEELRSQLQSQLSRMAARQIHSPVDGKKSIGD